MNINKLALLSGLIVSVTSVTSLPLSASASNLFVANYNANYNDNTISEIVAGTTTPITFASVLFARGLAFDKATAVPEPLNILGAVVGVGLFVGLKRRVR